MPTNFPTSVDALTNPVSNDSLNSPSHSAQHANANDAIEAIETFLLPGGAGNSGLVKVIPTGATNGTVAANGDVTIGSAVGSVTVSGAFNANYDSYKVIISGGVCSASPNISLRLGAAAANYLNSLFLVTYATGATGTAAESAGAAITWAGSGTTNSVNMNIELVNPFLVKPTTYFAPYNGATQAGYTSGIHNNNASYADFTITPSTGTLTGGTIHIYGYK